METWHVPIVLLVLVFSQTASGIYLISDYYMDHSWWSSTSQLCGTMVGDDCVYINSHLGASYLNYGSDIDCTATLDAGSHGGARYKLAWKRFDLEASANCAFDSLTMYDRLTMDDDLGVPFGTFCGGNEPNTTGFPAKRFLTLKFKTDGGTGKKGYRILATRTVPYPCPGFFHCVSENVCIDSRLKCDGTVQCQDESDESDCKAWEKFLGALLALGTTGLLGIIGAFTIFFTTLSVLICIYKYRNVRGGCLRHYCGCCYRSEDGNTDGMYGGAVVGGMETSDAVAGSNASNVALIGVKKNPGTTTRV